MTQWGPAGRPMSRWATRFWGGVGQRIIDSGALDSLTTKAGQTADESARLNEYDLRWAYFYNDDLYGRLQRAGLIEKSMPTEWNPIPVVVAFYVANTLSGNLSVQPASEAADAAALSAAVAQIWRWSNWPALRRKVATAGAVLRDVFVKVAERVPMADARATAVYLQDIVPSTARWWDADERDFLTAIRIDTPRLTSVFTGEEFRHVLVEVWRKDWGDGIGGVRYFELPAGQMVLDDRQATPKRAMTFEELGYDFIPIVWARVDTHWRQQVAGIDRYNALAWQAARLNRPLVIVSANMTDAVGRPLAAPLGTAEGMETLYEEEGDGVLGVVRMPGKATMTYAGNPIDFAALNLRMSEVREGVIASLPEFRVGTLDASTQLATETLELLLSHAGQRVLEMREGLERMLARAQMMAISIAQAAGLTPALFGPDVIGTYDDGRIEHSFEPRGVFEKSASARAAEVGALTAAGATIEGAARVAGYSEQQVEELVNLSIATFPEEQRDDAR